VLVGRQVLKEHGWKIGDNVGLKSLSYPLSLEFRIVGEIPNERSPHFWLRHEYLEEALREKGITLDRVSLIWASVADPNQVSAVVQAIDATFRNSDTETRSETERSFFASFFGSLQGLVRIIMLVTALVVVCIVFIAANTASLAIRERLRELAVMKALGFRWRTLFGLLVAEATFLSLLAGAIGAGIAIGLTLLIRRFAGWNPELGPLASFVVTQTVLVQGLFVALFAGIVSGVVPAYGASRRSVAQALREIF
jgi:putative ABC transport system permease protein